MGVGGVIGDVVFGGNTGGEQLPLSSHLVLRDPPTKLTHEILRALKQSHFVLQKVDVLAELELSRPPTS